MILTVLNILISFIRAANFNMKFVTSSSYSGTQKLLDINIHNDPKDFRLLDYF